MEKSELEKKLQDFEAGKATERDVAAAEKSFEIAKSNLDAVKKNMEAINEDYPELKPVHEALISTLEALNKEVSGLKTKRVEEDAESDKGRKLKFFNEHTKPEILKKHADFDKIVADPLYWDWANAKERSPALQTAALASPDPSDISWAISEFKKYKVTPEVAAALKKKQEEDKQRIQNAETLRGGGGAPRFAAKKADPESYDEGWAEAEALERQATGRR
jgi:hypothetical protein